MQESDDAVLVARSAGGDTGAFETLVERHHRVLFSVAVRMLGDYADASDATQAAFLKAYEKLGTFDPRFRFFSWIYRILLNECLNARRDRRPYEALTSHVAEGGGPLDAMEADERRRQVQRALLALPIDYRKVIVLRHFGGLPYDDIAAALGVPVKTVKSRLYSARQRLLDLLTAERAQTRRDDAHAR
jgi:RNA polymerase sigma-70 factor (ECF subfamily)